MNHQTIANPAKWSEMDGDARRVACLKGRVDGLSSSKIARLYYTTRNAVIGILHRMQTSGIKVPVSPHGTGSQKRTGSTTPLRSRAQNDGTFARSKKRRRISGGGLIPGLKAFEPIPGVVPVTLMECGPLNCRMAVDGLDGPSRLFCGAAKDPDQSWCPAHHALVYQPLDKRARAQRIAIGITKRAA